MGATQGADATLEAARPAPGQAQGAPSWAGLARGLAGRQAGAAHGGADSFGPSHPAGGVGLAAVGGPAGAAGTMAPMGAARIRHRTPAALRRARRVRAAFAL